MTAIAAKQKLCPVSFGLALGTRLTRIFIWTLWVIHYGPSAMMMASHMPVPTVSVVLSMRFGHC